MTAAGWMALNAHQFANVASAQPIALSTKNAEFIRSFQSECLLAKPRGISSRCPASLRAKAIKLRRLDNVLGLMP